jgi:hypothetical protein
MGQAARLFGHLGALAEIRSQHCQLLRGRRRPRGKGLPVEPTYGEGLGPALILLEPRDLLRKSNRSSVSDPFKQGIQGLSHRRLKDGSG